MLDEHRAQRAVSFFEHLRHTKGRFYGEPFNLLPWQESIVRNVYGTVNENGKRQYKYVYIEIPKKNGKALAVNTQIPTPNGWKRMADIQVGDMVFSETGEQCNVVAVSDVMLDRACYRVGFTNGQEIIADADHQWLTTTRRPESKTAIRTTAEIGRSVNSLNGLNHRIEIPGPLEIEERNLPLEPYLFGIWLGDGNSRDARITIADPEPLREIESLGYTCKHRESFGAYGYWITGISPILRSLDVFQNKHIPEIYLFSSFRQRLELLRGLMDSDGYCSPAGQCEFTNKNERLSRDVAKLVRSLGIKATSLVGQSTLHGKNCGLKYRVFFFPNEDIPVFYIRRKVINQKAGTGLETRSSRIYINSCKSIESVPVRCIQVDSPSRMYLATESFIPTHNSELAAGAGLYHTFADGELNGEVYGCAADRSQAGIVFDVAVEMIGQVPALKKRAKLTLSQHKLMDKVSGTTYKVMSAESYTKHGLNVSACIFDELHAQPNRNLWDVMTFGAGDAREQPIWWVITTAGDDPDRVSVGWEQHDYAMRVLSGDIIDPTWYVSMYGYEGDDIYNEGNWKLANPSLGTTITVDTVREAAEKAKVKPADERLFRWLRLNQWITTKLTTWQPIDLFDATVGDWTLADQLGKDCYLGLDLSSTTDLTALALVFPPQGEQLDWRICWHAWIPAENMTDRIRKDHIPYDQWTKAGWITPTAGNVVDYTKVEEAILEIKKFHKVIELDSDRAMATMLLQRLEQAGIVCVDIPQTYASLTDPMNQIEVLLKERKLTHEPNLAARWCFGNTQVAKNGQGYIKFVKEHKGKNVDRTKRIDLVAAWVNAMARARFYAGSVDISSDILSDDWGM